MNYFGEEIMKRFVAIIFVVLILFALIGCNGEQKEALQSVISHKIESQDVYTPDSYKEYLSALESAKTIKDGAFSLKKE